MTDSDERQARTITNIIVVDQARPLHRTYSLRLTITITQTTSRLKEIPRAQINILTTQVPVHILWLSSAGNESPRDYWLSGHLSAGSSYLTIRAVWLAAGKNMFPHSSKQTPRSKVLLKLGINMPTDWQIARQSCDRRLDRTRTKSNQLASLNSWLAERWSAEWLLYGLADRMFITRLNDQMANLLHCSDGQMLCN
jgi:hypothetical protein